MIEFFKNLFVWVVEHIQGLSLTASIVLIVLIIGVTVVVVIHYKRNGKQPLSVDFSEIKSENSQLNSEIAALKEENGLLLVKLNAVIEALITVYGNNIKSDGTRKAVLSVLQDGFYAEKSKITGILDELKALKEKAEASAATVIDKAEDVVKTVGTIAGLRG